MDGVNPDDLGGQEAEGTDGSGPINGGGEPTQDGTLSEEAAKALLDSVEEGRPRVVIPGPLEGKPW